MLVAVKWFFTLSWLTFSLLWGVRYALLRKGRKYAKARNPADRNLRYKYISYLVYLAQIFLIIPMFWLNSAALLKFHSSDLTRFIGLVLCFLGLALSTYALKHLGRNYSPCFDAHVPFQLVSTGPYRFIRHPGWLAKIFTGVGGVLVSGSWWFMPVLLWLLIEMRRTIRAEEKYLLMAFPEFADYRRRTRYLIPFIC